MKKLKRYQARIVAMGLVLTLGIVLTLIDYKTEKKGKEK